MLPNITNNLSVLDEYVNKVDECIEQINKHNKAIKVIASKVETAPSSYLSNYSNELINTVRTIDDIAQKAFRIFDRILDTIKSLEKKGKIEKAHSIELKCTLVLWREQWSKHFMTHSYTLHTLSRKMRKTISPESKIQFASCIREATFTPDRKLHNVIGTKKLAFYPLITMSEPIAVTNEIASLIEYEVRSLDGILSEIQVKNKAIGELADLIARAKWVSNDKRLVGNIERLYQPMSKRFQDLQRLLNIFVQDLENAENDGKLSGAHFDMLMETVFGWRDRWRSGLQKQLQTIKNVAEDINGHEYTHQQWREQIAHWSQQMIADTFSDSITPLGLLVKVKPASS